MEYALPQAAGSEHVEASGLSPEAVRLESWLTKPANQARINDDDPAPRRRRHDGMVTTRASRFAKHTADVYRYAEKLQGSWNKQQATAKHDAAMAYLTAQATARHDAITNAYLTAALRYVTEEIFKFEYAPLYFRQILRNIITPMPKGYANFTWRQTEGVGEAVAIVNDGDDLAPVDRVLAEFSQRRQRYGTSYGYTDFDSDADVVGAMPLVLESAQDSVDRVERRFESIAAFGDAQFKLNGFFQHGDVPILGVTSGYTPSGLTGNWLGLDLSSDVNKQKIISDVQILTKSIPNGTSNVEQGPFTLVMSLNVYYLLASTPRSSLSDITLLQFLRDSNPLVKAVEMWPLLTGANTGGTGGAGNGERIIAFTDDPRKLKYIEQVRFQQNAPRERGSFGWHVPCYGSTAGIIMPKPKAMVYWDL